MDTKPGAWDDPERDFKYRAGCTLLIDPEEMQIRRVIRTPGPVDDEDELDRMRHYLLDGLSPPNAFAGVAARFGEGRTLRAFLQRGPEPWRRQARRRPRPRRRAPAPATPMSNSPANGRFAR